MLCACFRSNRGAEALILLIETLLRFKQIHGNGDSDFIWQAEEPGNKPRLSTHFQATNTKNNKTVHYDLTDPLTA